MSIPSKIVQGATARGQPFEARLHVLADGSFGIAGIEAGGEHVVVDETTAYRSESEALQGAQRILAAKGHP